MSVSDLPALARPSIRLRLGGSLRDVLSTRGGSRLLTAVTIAGFAVPAAIYLWLIQRFSVNVVFVDQWSDVSLIGRSYHGTLTFGSLWAQHNENRLLFPNLLSLLIARTSSFDVVVEEYVGAVFLFAAVALLVLAHRRRSPELPWIAYCPVAILSLSVAQAGNTLWGFQLAWYLVMLMLAVTLFLLDAPELHRGALVAAVAAAVVGSYSSLQGLFIWVAGLVLLYYRRRPWPAVLTWCAAAAVTAALYFVHYDWEAGAPSRLSGLHLPGDAARFFLTAIGDVLGAPLSNKGDSTRVDAVMVFGVVVLAVAAYLVATRGRRRDSSTGAPLGFALMAFGVLFAASVAYGRAWSGPLAASASRYVTFDLLVVTGSYLVLISGPAPADGPAHRARRLVGPVVVGTLAVIVMLQAVLGLVDGIRAARSLHGLFETQAVVLADVEHLPDPVLHHAVPAFSPAYIRRNAQLLQQHHLSIFSDPRLVANLRREAVDDRRGGLFALPPAVTIATPRRGAKVSGRVTLDALLRSDARAAAVTFYLGASRSAEPVGSARRTKFGWILVWDSSTVPDGTYQLIGVATRAGGGTVGTATVPVTVAN